MRKSRLPISVQGQDYQAPPHISRGQDPLLNTNRTTLELSQNTEKRYVCQTQSVQLTLLQRAKHRISLPMANDPTPTVHKHTYKVNGENYSSQDARRSQHYLGCTCTLRQAIVNDINVLLAVVPI